MMVVNDDVAGNDGEEELVALNSSRNHLFLYLKISTFRKFFRQMEIHFYRDNEFLPLM
jgi:hypothetical protein